MPLMKYSILFSLAMIVFLGVVLLLYFTLPVFYASLNIHTDENVLVRHGNEVPATILKNVNHNSKLQQNEFLIGYEPLEESCQTFLLNRIIQRSKQRERRLQEQFDINFSTSYFQQKSEKAIDQLFDLEPENFVEGDGAMEGGKRQLRNLGMSYGVRHSETTIDDVGNNLVFRNATSDVLKQISSKKARDVLLPLVLDDIFSEDSKLIQGQYVERGESLEPFFTVKSTYEVTPFFETEVIRSFPRFETSSELSKISNDIVMSSVDEEMATDYELVTTQWLKHVEIDRVLVSLPESLKNFEFASLKPCIKFIESPQNHPVEKDIESLEEESLGENSITNDTLVGRSDSNTTNQEHTFRILKEENDHCRYKESPPISKSASKSCVDVLETGTSNRYSQLNNSLDNGSVSNEDILKRRLLWNVSLPSFDSTESSTYEDSYQSSKALATKPQVIPNDPEFSKQWQLPVIQAPEAWGSWTGPPMESVAPGSIVAVLDTGCALNHNDLQDKFWRNEGEVCDNGIDDDGNGYIDDCYGWNFNRRNANLTDERGHGTSVVGAIAANTNNKIGIAGICWGCRILCARIGVNEFNTASFAEALNYAIGWDVKVVNYSGNGWFSSIQKEAIQTAWKKNVIVVTCSGNNGCNIDGEEPCVDSGYPGKLELENIINVGASDPQNMQASYSNYGGRGVDVFAPSGILLPSAGKKEYKQVYGTSFAAPIVAGAVALIISKYPTLTVDQIKRALLSTCTRYDNFINKAQCPGILNILESLKKAESMVQY